ncbi:hypothetical protein AC249_AIPGENE16776 [Exaiptasia diaphana]|nr:hypothetical protein AC249_AIPGENE16776 [Exaiptasia diaphana]
MADVEIIEPENSSESEVKQILESVDIKEPMRMIIQKRRSKRNKIQDKSNELEMKHGNKFQPYQYKLWAEMLDSQGKSTRMELIRQLKELHELEELGVLTEQEFQDKKTIILNEMH